MKKVDKLFEIATSHTHDVWPLLSTFVYSAHCSYPCNSAAPRTQLTPAPCCLVPSGAASTCPGYIPLHLCVAVGASLYPNGDPGFSPLQSGSGKDTLLCLGAGGIGLGCRKTLLLSFDCPWRRRMGSVQDPSVYLDWSPSKHLLYSLSLALASNFYHPNTSTVTFTQLPGLTAVSSSSKVQLLFPLAIPITLWSLSRHLILQCLWLSNDWNLHMLSFIVQKTGLQYLAVILLPFN